MIPVQWVTLTPTGRAHAVDAASGYTEPVCGANNGGRVPSPATAGEKLCRRCQARVGGGAR